MHDLLRTTHPGVNHKRVYRLYRAADLAVRKRAKAKRPVGARTPLVAASHVNATWSMDFVSDSLCNGRRLKCLTVADDFSHECVDIAVDFGIGGEYVTRLLDQAARFRGYPQAVRTDNGPEFTSRAFLDWAKRHGIKHILIEPGAPTQNGYIESFNGKFRDECLNEHWFETLAQARVVIRDWVQDYNEVRPHSSIGRMPPRCFARFHRQHAGDESSTSTAALAIPLPPGLPRNEWYGNWGQVNFPKIWSTPNSQGISATRSTTRRDTQSPALLIFLIQCSAIKSPQYNH